MTDTTELIDAPQWNALAPVVIVSEDHYVAVVERLKINKAFQDHVKTFFKPLKEKAYAAWKALCQAENDHLAPAQADEARDKAAMVAWVEEQERLRREEQLRIEALARQQEEERRLAEAAAAEAAGDVEAAQAMLDDAIETKTPVVIVASTVSKIAGVSYRETWNFRITDESQIPREYLKVDEVKIRKVVQAMKGNTKIAGVQVYSERSAAASGK